MIMLLNSTDQESLVRVACMTIARYKFRLTDFIPMSDGKVVDILDLLTLENNVDLTRTSLPSATCFVVPTISTCLTY